MKALAKGAWVGGRIFMICVMGAIVAGVFAAGLGTIVAVLGISWRRDGQKALPDRIELSTSPLPRECAR